MNNGNNALGGGVYMSAFDYLSPSVNRPDVFLDRTNIKSSIYRGKPGGSDTKVWATLALVILSAFIFVTIVAWATVLQSYLDAKIVNPIIGPLVTSRLWYAVIVTIITIVLLVGAVFLYYQTR